MSDQLFCTGENYSMEWVYRMKCSLKLNTGIPVRVDLVCLARQTGDDLTRREISSLYRNISGNFLSKFAFIDDLDQLEQLICKEPGKVARAVDKLRTYMDEEISLESAESFRECKKNESNEMIYQRACVDNHADMVNGYRMIAQCMRGLEYSDGCSEVVKNVRKNPKKITHFMCESKDSYARFWSDFKCVFRKESYIKISHVQQFLDCIESFVKKKHLHHWFVARVAEQFFFSLNHLRVSIT